MIQEVLELYAFIGRQVVDRYEAGSTATELLTFIAGCVSVLREKTMPVSDETVIDTVIDNARLSARQRLRTDDDEESSE